MRYTMGLATVLGVVLGLAGTASAKDYCYTPKCYKVWCPPVYETVCKKIWHEPVYDTVCRKVWVPPVTCQKPYKYYDHCGRCLIGYETVVATPGYYKEYHETVLVKAGYYEPIYEKVLVQPGHWITKCY
jgi:hypothetical protein